jgi:hypothetical protein
MANFLLDAALNAMLDGTGLAGQLDQVSLHTAYSNSGANEVTGGAYARQAITWNAAASGALDSSNAPSFSVPSGNTVRFIGFWETAASPDTFQGMLPNQQAGDLVPRRFVVDTTNNQISMPAHGLVVDEAVVFIGGTPPSPLVEGTVYYAVDVLTDAFGVQSTQGGSPGTPIALTTQGDEDVRIWQIREETFASDGTFNLTDADFDFLT